MDNAETQENEIEALKAIFMVCIHGLFLYFRLTSTQDEFVLLNNQPVSYSSDILRALFNFGIGSAAIQTDAPSLGRHRRKPCGSCYRIHASGRTELSFWLLT